MKRFWIDTLERAIKTAAQVAVATIGTAELLGNINWPVVASTVGVATLLSLLTSIASRKIGDRNSPSLVDEHSVE